MIWSLIFKRKESIKMNLKKALPALGFCFGLLLASNDGKYFPAVNIIGLLIFGLSCFKLNRNGTVYKN